MKILVTGGAGYIGSHTCLALLNEGYEVVIVDNLCNSSIESIKRIEILANQSVIFYNADVRDMVSLENVFHENSIEAVIHFAGLKSVNESINIPINYYENNVGSSIALFNIMSKFNCKILVFSSSATVYGDTAMSPIKEGSQLSANNPYGRSKLMIEEILQDLYVSDDTWHIGRLRYFNPVGAHKSGMIGEDPNGIPNNLFPYISQVAVGRRKKVNIFGGDYDTHDGTGVRDYIHVMDIADGHIKALEALNIKSQLLTINLGTGNGYSVLDVIKAFESASGLKIPYKIVGRREGDIASCYADTALASSSINWNASYNLESMCKDAWKWQTLNPNGYQKIG
tara:strand:- start:824 stop:1843 length:1020 start_codon:yes stop_codon:yes gene_type:complete